MSLSLEEHLGGPEYWMRVLLHEPGSMIALCSIAHGCRPGIVLVWHAVRIVRRYFMNTVELPEYKMEPSGAPGKMMRDLADSAHLGRFYS